MVAGPGRPPGSRNKRDLELFARIKARGDREGVDILSEIANDKNEPTPLRIQAAIGVAAYQTSKPGLIPAPPPKIFVEQPVALPHPRANTVEQTVRNVQHISRLFRRGQLDQATADVLVSEQRILRDSLVEQAKVLIAQGGPKDQRIVIQGGLPNLPGCDIDMEGTQFAARVAAATAFPKVVNGEHVRDGQIVPTTDAIPPNPTWPHTPKKPDDPA
jgi:hypothetical protein